MKLFRIHSSHVTLATALCALGMLPTAAIAAWTPDPAGGGDPALLNVSVFNEDGALEAMLPEEFGGHGSFCFEVGNNSGTAIGYDADATTAQLVKFTVSVANGRPNTTTPYDPTQALAVLTGPLLTYFDMTYTPPVDTNDPTQGGIYSGIQIVQLDGNTSFQACFPYLVTVNKYDGQNDPKNGSNVNIQPPAYLNNNGDATENNQASSYTFVDAKDFGDAPTSGTAPNGTGTNNYGSATATIDLSKDVNGFYNQYMYLGASVDPEDVNQASDSAVGDDANQTGGLNVDDEDGVTFPTMLPGATVTIPVSVTIVDEFETFPSGFLNAWIDWNGDGDWADSGERIAAAISVVESGTVNLNITVPAGAINNVYTYARFRFGRNANTTSTASYGEVEDYRIFIGDPTAVTIGSVDLKAVSVKDFLGELGIGQMDDAALLDILRAWDPELAASVGAGRDAILAALRRYLDPDGDGQVALLRWGTLEERGTIGFYVERSDASGEGSTVINNDMLPGLINAPMGGEYLLADPVPTSGNTYQYRFIEQEATGNTREYGPYKVEMPQ